MKKSLLNGLIIGLAFTGSTSALGAIALDRTRVIFPGSEKNVSVTITNENKEKPFLAQAWLENERNEKISTPFLITPPIQRVEPDQRSVIRINLLPEAKNLPQDRETVFWFNVREVPPRSEHANVMQVALQSKIKMFYRPAPIIAEKNAHWADQLILHRNNRGYVVENPTPYYINLIAVTAGKKDIVRKDFVPVMIAPKSSFQVNAVTSDTPYITTINDFGGRPATPFRCKGNTCHAET